MQLSVVVSCFVAILVNIAFAKEHIIMGILGHKPEEGGLPIGPDDHNQDGCPRKYPLTPKNAQEVPYAFKRYSVVPHLLAEPPAELVEVRVLQKRNQIE